MRLGLQIATAIAWSIAIVLLIAAPARSQYWSYPPGYYYPPLRQHTAPRPRHGPRTRSAEQWKESIKAQGRAYCRAHPSDSICPH
jgi:hypothetical protein